MCRPPVEPMARRIPREILRVGFCLPGALRGRDGRVLLDAGARIGPSDMDQIESHAVSGLYAEDDWPENFLTEATQVGAPQPEGVTISVDQLQCGTRLPQEICDGPSSVLLLAAGTKITERFLELLKRRNIKTVTLGTAQTGPQVSDRAEQLASELDETHEEELGEPVPVRPIRSAERPRLPFNELKSAAAAGLERHAEVSDLIVDVCQAAHRGKTASCDLVAGAVDDLSKMVARDFDLAPLIVSMQQSGGEYLFDHSVNVSLMTMSISAQLGWKREQVAEVGLGSMLQDVGMLQVPETIRLAPRRITADEWQEIETHPCHALYYLERISGLPTATKFIAYQSHERGDRSGYPKQRSGMFLHPYSKIVAIADSFAAMTHARPYRAPILPYLAAKRLLTDTSQDKFDRTFMRAFLDAVSLFPVGSWVELDDGTRARVIRANPGLHTAPVVEAIDANGEPAGSLIDISKQPHLSVVSVFESPAATTDGGAVAVATLATSGDPTR